MILIIAENTSTALPIREMLYYMGIPSDFKRISGAHTTDIKYRAALYIALENEMDTEYIKRLKGEYGSMPILVLTDTLNEYGLPHFKKSTPISEIILSCRGAILNNGMGDILSYKLFGIDASSENQSVQFFGKRIHLTKSQRMILTTLISQHPKPVKTSDILRLAFKDGRAPLSGSIRTHIYSINKAFRIAFGEPIITSTPDGYFIVSPNEKYLIKDKM